MRATPEEAVHALLALLPPRPTALFEGGNFFGFYGGPEHRTVGAHRAWCYDASEWCYPSVPCVACDPPLGNEELRRVMGL